VPDAGSLKPAGELLELGTAVDSENHGVGALGQEPGRRLAGGVHGLHRSHTTGQVITDYDVMGCRIDWFGSKGEVGVKGACLTSWLMRYSRVSTLSCSVKRSASSSLNATIALAQPQHRGSVRPVRWPVAGCDAPLHLMHGTDISAALMACLPYL